jgi:hypothetical protein
MKLDVDKDKYECVFSKRTLLQLADIPCNEEIVYAS